MIIYVTSKNSGPSWVSETKTMLYIGTSLEEAENVVPENFRRLKSTKEEMNQLRFPYLYSAVPDGTKFKFVHLHQADGWWYSVVSIEVEPHE